MDQSESRLHREPTHVTIITYVPLKLVDSGRTHWIKDMFTLVSSRNEEYIIMFKEILSQ